MNERTSSTNSPSQAQAPARGRRRFLGAGVSATPALLTLASHPALAVTCFTPSRSLSRNTSVGQELKNGICNGKSPGNYGAQTDPFDNNGKPNPAYTWPKSVPPDTPFHSVFNGTRFYIDILVIEEVVQMTPNPNGRGSDKKTVLRETIGSRSLTFWEVITLNTRSAPADLAPGASVPLDPANLGKHIAAAYLNCVNELIPLHILTAKQVQEIWLQWDTKGYFEPMAPVKWYEADIVDYLTSNGIAP